MAKKRKFVAYRRLERPYTRKSKYREKSFIRASPANRITRYNMGNVHKDFAYKLLLIPEEGLQIRDLALESCRLFINRHCEKRMGKSEFYLKLRVFPHHHLRENALASGAGADRLSTGMKFSFGKVVGIAAQVNAGQPIVELNVNKNNLNLAKRLLKTSATKLPCSCKVIVEQQ